MDLLISLSGSRERRYVNEVDDAFNLKTFCTGENRHLQMKMSNSKNTITGPPFSGRLQ